MAHAWCANLHGRSVHRRFRLVATFFCRKHAFQFRSTRDLAFSTRTRLVFPSTSISASACGYYLNVNSCDLSLERDDGIAPSRHPRTVAQSQLFIWLFCCEPVSRPVAPLTRRPFCLISLSPLHIRLYPSHVNRSHCGYPPALEHAMPPDPSSRCTADNTSGLCRYGCGAWPIRGRLHLSPFGQEWVSAHRARRVTLPLPLPAPPPLSSSRRRAKADRGVALLCVADDGPILRNST